ncbi:MAG: 50S ribosomal protein L23 [Ruminococcaceae bacterium]|nr:50S ribosomal protein L23 [Oscillospiraceae bacterium]
MNKYDIIVRPYITEKTTDLVAEGKYAFVVDIRATKIDIKKAVEDLFNVKVLSVNTARFDGKKRIQRQASGAAVGYTNRWKKAIVKIDTDPKAEEYLTAGGKKATSAKKYKNSIDEFGFTQ